jgi:hypothetical protein
MAVAALSLILAACTAPPQRAGKTSSPSPSSSGGAAPSKCPKPVVPPGIYQKTLVAKDFTHTPAGDISQGWSSVGPGDWTWIVRGTPDANCYYEESFTQKRFGRYVFTDAHPYTVLGPDQIVLHGANEAPGRYRVVIQTNAQGTTSVRLVPVLPFGACWGICITKPWLKQSS